jgi:plasmid stabilization system protein ParE
VKATVLVVPGAQKQIEEAENWWRAHREAAPDLLAEEWEAALRMLAERPSVGRPAPRSRHRRLRIMLLPRTRYHVYFEHDETVGIVSVLALWSAVRGRRPRLRH